jgi:hypothetical protein
MATHIKILGWLHVLFSLFGLLIAATVFAGGMLGGIFSGSMSGLVGGGLGGAFVAAFLAAFALPGLLAGYGLLTLKPWARPLTIVLGVLDLIRFPFGTVLGIYTLWVMLSAEGAAQFRRQVI